MQGGWAAKNSSTFARTRRLRNTTRPDASAPCAWKNRFAISNPIVLACPTDASSSGRHHHLGTLRPSGASIPSGLVALKERSPSVKDIILDMETLTVSKANTKIEDTPVRTIIMGEVYLERKETGKSQQFLCLIGEKGKVLLTFFTAK